MLGIPALLMVATLGVTYGWQPDGRDGVEYLIQIPPEQLSDIERLGGISSTIDPAVRGRVSRVIVRVGNDELPRTTPPNFANQASQTNGLVAQADHTPMPIPQSGEFGEAIPIGSMGPRDQASVMKPQTGDANRGSNFALPPSLRGSTENSQTPATRFAAPPSTDPRGQAPQFTGNDPQGSMARPRPGGPSTDPVTGRDNSWSDLTGRRPGGPSTDPMSNQSPNPNPFGLPANDSRTAASGDNPRGATGLGPGDMFGRAPGESAAPTAGSNSNSLYPTANRTESVNPSYPPAIPNRSNLASTNDNFPRGTVGQSANASVYPYDSPSAGNGVNATPIRSNQLNPGYTLPTAAELALLPPGTSALDPYGRPVDLDGRVLDRSGRPIDPYAVAAANEANRLAQSNLTRSSLGFPSTYPPANGNSAPRSYTDPRSPSDGNFARTLPDPNSNLSQSFRAEEPSTVNVAGNGARNSNPPPPLVPSGNSGRVEVQPVSAQPLFNGLLLISFVANIYLIFWLKNLRYQFRDLIAAKRIAAASSNPSS